MFTKQNKRYVLNTKKCTHTLCLQHKTKRLQTRYVTQQKQNSKFTNTLYLQNNKKKQKKRFKDFVPFYNFSVFHRDDFVNFTYFLCLHAITLSSFSYFTKLVY